jgi:hypothetical protein
MAEAIDQAVKQYPEGEFMKNVVVKVRSNGRRIKVSGDVWGISSVDKSVKQKVNVDVEFKTGDAVAFKNSNGKFIEGTIIGQNSSAAVVEYLGNYGKIMKDEVSYGQLTKIQRAENSDSTYKVNSGVLSIRSGADSKSPIIKRVSGGTKVHVIEKTNSDFWRIKYEGIIGYVPATYLSK